MSELAAAAAVVGTVAVVAAGVLAGLWWVLTRAEDRDHFASEQAGEAYPEEAR